ncbi:hypothetical protein OQJ19_02095 [Fluoribacter gormanii]|uniref:Uncharacterized protein n=1 Tax=Fluoribacter gormanii TaxID=464 RepID=A0A377GHF1_9GAMM|nr:hypothetical protein [Fluoribacter gormanii]KTD03275.1 hypothetical protein Lgor_1260 [Fluoribacter gormanii]MCW8444253.1 hypothetical protein [Fluoribacter gormanii]MCW8469446.1 hypothetical protein [Fluoribacter gormanii]SIR72373.1 hypothetical protein SAMN05421777_12142 [Fluoribacter gormanii]STO24227.1 Uncharacterised protein [Fluoribacter gormanii]
MLLTLALVVLFSAITVFFSEEFIKAFKKLFAIKGAKLLIPMFVASWFIYTFNFWFLWGIFYAREILHDVLNFLVRIMPFEKGAVSVVLVFMLTVLSVVPVLILDVLSRRKNFKGYQHPYVASGLIWILSVFLLIII